MPFFFQWLVFEKYGSLRRLNHICGIKLDCKSESSKTIAKSPKYETNFLIFLKFFDKFLRNLWNNFWRIFGKIFYGKL